jgi:hypothetical protein
MVRSRKGPVATGPRGSDAPTGSRVGLQPDDFQDGTVPRPKGVRHKPDPQELRPAGERPGVCPAGARRAARGNVGAPANCQLTSDS